MLLHALREASGVGWPFTRNDVGEPGAAGHFYRPLWLLWNLGIYRIFGASPAAFHIANFLLYAVIVAEVWLLVRRLAGSGRAWIVASLFAVYPRHGESVAWVSGNTDLVAVALGLAALLCGLSRWPIWVRLATASLFAAAAALSKEVAFVLPVLAALALWLGPGDRDRRRWLVPAGMAAAAVTVFAVRAAVLHQLGGYSGYPWTPARIVLSAGSYAVASLTPPSVEVFRFLPVLLVPAALCGLAVWRCLVLRRRGDRESLRIVALGLAWFAIGLLPFLNLAADLNNANGERLMFLSTVGLAIAVAGLLERQVRPALAAVAVAGLAALSLYSSFDWPEAGRISDRVIRSAVRLGPPGGEIVLLDAPENYRTAHVFTGGNMDAALRFRERSLDLSTAVCSQVTVRRVQAGVVRFRPLGTAFQGTTTWSAPFDLPVGRSTAALTGDCSYTGAKAGKTKLGLGLSVEALPRPSRPRVVLAYFDGRDLRRCCK